ncbi:hypothetical protein J6590_040308 [Homalodisca vitripennis]|nr:hypothetical protein J6590_040308 [Homalodisca vitripennis]
MNLNLKKQASIINITRIPSTCIPLFQVLQSKAANCYTPRATTIKALTSAPMRASLSMPLMFTGKVFHNRQIENLNDLLKVVDR